MTATESTEACLIACIDLIGLTGAERVQVRYTDDEPVVWLAMATWRADPEGVPTPDGTEVHDTTAGMTPFSAVWRLTESIVDGAVCKKCGRSTGVTIDFAPMPMREKVCWWQYDSDHQKFVRGCGAR